MNDPERPSDDGRFVLSDDGWVRIAAGAARQVSDDDAGPNWWLRGLVAWIVGLAVLFVWWQIDAGQCAARVEAACAAGPCGPDAGWGCGLGGAFLLMLWVAVLGVAALAAAALWLLRFVRRSAGRSESV